MEKRCCIDLPVYEMCGFRYVRASDLEGGIRDRLGKWLIGQTRPMIPDVPISEQDAVFLGDWEKFCAGLPVID